MDSTSIGPTICHRCKRETTKLSLHYWPPVCPTCEDIYQNARVEERDRIYFKLAGIGWFFADETYTTLHGPYTNQDEAKEAAISSMHQKTYKEEK